MDEYSHYKVGEVVAVAQSYRDISNEVFGFATKVRGKGSIAGWGNKMFVKAELMPHHIRNTNIRVEMLQDISDEDCLAEGVREHNMTIEGNRYSYYTCNGIGRRLTKTSFEEKVFRSPREAYAALIDKVSGKGTWESNPYVLAYEFVKED